MPSYRVGLHCWCKTTVMIAALDSITLQEDGYVLVCAPNRPMMQKLHALLTLKMTSETCVRAGVEWQNNEPSRIYPALSDELETSNIHGRQPHQFKWAANYPNYPMFALGSDAF